MKIIILLMFLTFKSSSNFYTITIQPYENFSTQEIEYVKVKLEKAIYSMSGEYPNIRINKAKRFDKSLMNSYGTRYRADKIIRSLSGNNDNIIIALVHSDISIPYKGKADWGVLGLCLRPGYVCVASDFRVKNKKRDFWKVVLHEYIHTRYNYSHCPKDNPNCIIKDAKGHANFSNKNELCNYCKKQLNLKYSINK